MDAIQAHNLGYAVAARIGLRNTQVDRMKTASAEDLHARVGKLVARHGVRLQKRANRIQALHAAITAA